MEKKREEEALVLGEVMIAFPLKLDKIRGI